MNTTKISIALVFIALILGLEPILAQPGTFLSYSHKDTTYLRWAGLYENGVEGYEVFKKNGSGPWQLLNSSPLRPLRLENELRDVLGYKTALYYSLLGFDEPKGDIPASIYQDLFARGNEAGFFRVIAFVNPEFGFALGEAFVDSDPGQSPSYKIHVIKNGNSEPYLSPQAVKPQPEKLMPAGELLGEGQHLSARLEWDTDPVKRRSGKIVAYNLYRADKLIGPYSRINPYGKVNIRLQNSENQANKESFEDNSLINGKSYFYYVRPMNAFGFEGAESNVVEVVPSDKRRLFAPRNISIRDFGTGLQINWAPNEEEVKGYEIWQSNGLQDTFTRIHPIKDFLLGPDTSYTLSNVEVGDTYFFYLVSVGENGNKSEASDTLAFRPMDLIAPVVPTGLEAVAESGNISLKWNKNEENDLYGYRVYRAYEGNWQEKSLLNGEILTQNSFSEKLPPEIRTRLGYYVTAIDNNFNESAPSERVVVRMPDISPPSPPITLSALTQDKEVEIKWRRNTEADLKVYLIYRRPEGEGDFSNIGESKTNFFRDRPEAYGSYEYLLAAVDSSNLEGRQLNPIKLTLKQPPPSLTPISGEVKLEGNYLKITWQPVANVQIGGYLIRRINLSNQMRSDKADVDAATTAYTDRRISPGISYKYQIIAYDQAYRLSPPLTITYQAE